MVFASLGEYDKAISDCNMAIDLSPEYALYYYNRGICYEEKGEQDKATADYNMAIKLDPERFKKPPTVRDLPRIDLGR